MGLFDRFRGKRPDTGAKSHPNVPRMTFSASPTTLNDVLSVLQSSEARISRSEALSIPAVCRGLELLCQIASLPILQYRVADNEVVDSPLLQRIDPDVSNVVTLSQTIEDLALEGIAWWRVTGRDFGGFPTSARRLDPATVSLNQPVSSRLPAPLPSGLDPRNAVVWIDGSPVSANDVIRFDSPNHPILVVGARTIRRAILLDRTAKLYASQPLPTGYLTDGQNAQEMTDDDRAQLQAQFIEAIKRNAWPYLADVVAQQFSTPNAQELQLVELQRQASLEIANLFGVDPEDLGLNVTSRTYFNAQDRRLSRVNETLALYIRAITDTLSYENVTRRGYAVRFDLADYLKADALTRAQVQQIYVQMGVLSPQEVREAEGIAGNVPTKPEPPAAPPAPDPAQPVDQPPQDQQPPEVPA